MLVETHATQKQELISLIAAIYYKYLLSFSKHCQGVKITTTADLPFINIVIFSMPVYTDTNSCDIQSGDA